MKPHLLVRPSVSIFVLRTQKEAATYLDKNKSAVPNQKAAATLLEAEFKKVTRRAAPSGANGHEPHKTWKTPESRIESRSVESKRRTVSAARPISTVAITAVLGPPVGPQLIRLSVGSGLTPALNIAFRDRQVALPHNTRDGWNILIGCGLKLARVQRASCCISSIPNRDWLDNSRRRDGHSRGSSSNLGSRYTSVRLRVGPWSD